MSVDFKGLFDRLARTYPKSVKKERNLSLTLTERVLNETPDQTRYEGAPMFTGDSTSSSVGFGVSSLSLTSF